MLIPFTIIDPCKNDLALRIKEAFIDNFSTELSSLTEPLTIEAIYQMIEVPADESMGDYALPCFRFSKAFKKNPASIAEALAKSLNKNKGIWLSEAKNVQAFLNFTINPSTVAKDILPQIFSEEFFTIGNANTKSENVMIEFSQPNTHKEFHVGHMRNVALGDSLCRLFRYLGYPVIAANYIGDEGAHIAKCLWYLLKENAPIPEEGRGSWLGQMYSHATQVLEEANESDKKTFESEISKILRNLEERQEPLYGLWEKTKGWSMDAFHEIYEWLDVKFDNFFYESEMSEESQKIVDEYLKHAVFHESQGAIGIDLKAYGIPFLMLRKSDGTSLYATKDLALAQRKFEKYKITKSIYVVGSEQELHFRQVFKTLELMGFQQAKDSYHLSYGMVELPEGKMSSRKGNTISFTTLKERLSEELEKPLSKYKSEWSGEEYDSTKKKLAVGAIKYGMLETDPVKNIVFDMKEWLSFEGNTGPYLMYSYARTKSILRKGEELGAKPSLEHIEKLTEHTAFNLIKRIRDFNEVVLQAALQLKPSLLTTHLFYMCKEFNRFYTELPVLKVEDEKVRSARLMLLDAFAKTLYKGLHLLGIIPPERM